MISMSPRTTVHELVRKYPYLLEYLAGYHPEFRILKNPAARATLGRMATLEKVAALAGVTVDRLMADIARRVKETGDGASGPETGKTERLKEIIRSLHAGGKSDALRAEFAELLESADPTDIARMEQSLIQEGMPVEEIQRLCDLHVQVFQGGLERQDPVVPPPGHPLHTYQMENQEIARRAQQWVDRCRILSDGIPEDAAGDLRAALDRLAAVEIHYTRKENQLFPYLEKQGFTGPSQVMWALHDEVRKRIRDLRAAIEKGDAAYVRDAGTELARIISEMIYKEEKILFPNALDLLPGDAWPEIRRGDDEIGYLVPPAGPGPDGAASGAPPEPSAPDGTRKLTTGSLTFEQLDRMLLSMPVEFSFVDDQDTVRYYSGQADRVFPRSPGVIGRKVQHCHPPKSLDRVNAILDSFRSGTRDRAEFWIRAGDKFLYISYHAVRDARGRYLGTLEVTQDATHIRRLEGERRLLEDA